MKWWITVFQWRLYALKPCKICVCCNLSHLLGVTCSIKMHIPLQCLWITCKVLIKSWTDRCLFRYSTVDQMFGGSYQLPNPTTAEWAVIKSNCWAQFRQHSPKLGWAAEHLINGSNVIERRSNCVSKNCSWLSHNRCRCELFTKPPSQACFCQDFQRGTKHIQKRLRISNKMFEIFSSPVLEIIVLLKLRLHPYYLFLENWRSVPACHFISELLILFYTCELSYLIGMSLTSSAYIKGLKTLSSLLPTHIDLFLKPNQAEKFELL